MPVIMPVIYARCPAGSKVTFQIKGSNQLPFVSRENSFGISRLIERVFTELSTYVRPRPGGLKMHLKVTNMTYKVALKYRQQSQM